jgi:hypothetical protein
MFISGAAVVVLAVMTRLAVATAPEADMLLPILL